MVTFFIVLCVPTCVRWTFLLERRIKAGTPHKQRCTTRWFNNSDNENIRPRHLLWYDRPYDVWRSMNGLCSRPEVYGPAHGHACIKVLSYDAAWLSICKVNNTWSYPTKSRKLREVRQTTYACNSWITEGGRIMQYRARRQWGRRRVWPGCLLAWTYSVTSGSTFNDSKNKAIPKGVTSPKVLGISILNFTTRARYPRSIGLLISMHISR